MIIAFDGCERTGKTTQIKMLKDYLQKKGYVVKSFHTSLLAGHDVTKMIIPENSKLFAYIAALEGITYALLCLPVVWKKKPCVWLLDRYIFSHQVYCERYYPKDFKTINQQYFTSVINRLKKTGHVFTTICLLKPYIKDKSYDTELMKLFENMSIPGAEIIKVHNSDLSKIQLHESIKEAVKL